MSNRSGTAQRFRNIADKVDQIRARLGDLADADPSLAEDIRDLKLELAGVADSIERLADA